MPHSYIFLWSKALDLWHQKTQSPGNIIWLISSILLENKLHIIIYLWYFWWIFYIILLVWISLYLYCTCLCLFWENAYLFYFSCKQNLNFKSRRNFGHCVLFYFNQCIFRDSLTYSYCSPPHILTPDDLALLCFPLLPLHSVLIT